MADNRVRRPADKRTAQVLAGLSAAQIASQLGTSSSPVAQAIDGAAKVIIAAINQALRAEPGRG